MTDPTSWKRQFDEAAGMSDDQVEAALETVKTASSRRRVHRVQAVTTSVAAVFVLAAFVVGNVVPQVKLSERLASSVGIAPETTSPPTTSATTKPPVTTPPARPANVGRDGDVDGDGQVDSVKITHEEQNATLTVAMTKLGTQTLNIPASITADGPGLTGQSFLKNLPAVIGIHDLDADGNGEIVLLVNEGASTHIAAIVRVVDGKLAVMKNQDGSPFTVAYSGSLGHLDGFRCMYQGNAISGSRQFLTTSSAATATAGEGPWTGTVTQYQFDGSTLRQVSKSTTPYKTYDERKFGYYGAIECDDFAVTGDFAGPQTW